MAAFPRIDSPCPYKSNLAAVMDGDFCRMCERQVFDLTALSDRERSAFLAGCEEDEVCVSYRLPFRPAIAAAALAAAAMSAPLAAQEIAAPEVTVEDAIDTGAYAYDDMEIMVGGIKDPKAAAFVEADTDPAVPELPVVYEDTAVPAAPASAVKSPAGA